MIEFLRHVSGACGDHWHPNIWTFLAGGVGLSASFSYIKYKLSEFKQNKQKNGK